MNSRTDTSLLDAASNGAAQATSLILGIVANLVAFVSFIAFADGMLKWITFLLGFDDVGIEFILGKVFVPVSWVIGVDWADCEAVGNVIGTKTVVNEFVAFQLLGQYKADGVISVRQIEFFNIFCNSKSACSLDHQPSPLTPFVVSLTQAQLEF